MINQATPAMAAEGNTSPLGGQRPTGQRITAQQKEQIARLRYEGKSYPQIAEVTGICKNTIQTYCYRNNLGGNINKTVGQFRLCKNCGKVTRQTRGKEKLFCCYDCRMEWWSHNRDRMSDNSTYTIICEHCHKEFKTYGNKHQRFCSRHCYFEHRYGRQEVPDDDKRPDEPGNPLSCGPGNRQADALAEDHQPEGL